VLGKRVLRRILYLKGRKCQEYEENCIMRSFITSLSSSSSSSSFLGSTAQLRPWPSPQNPAEFLGGFSIFFFTR
jgi:hypothetical protein